MGTFGGAQPIVTDGLVFAVDAANYESYTSGSSTWSDLLDNSNGTLNNSPTFNNNYGGTITCDGTNDSVSFGSLDLSNTNQVTVDAWARFPTWPEVPGGAKVFLEFSTNNNSYTDGFGLYYSNDSNSTIYSQEYGFSITIQGNVGYNLHSWPKTYFNDGNFHHIICILDKSETSQEGFMYVDGEYALTESINNSNYIKNNTNNFGDRPFFLASRNATQINSNVEYGSVKIYNKRLTPTEITQNYNALKGRFGL